MLQSCEHCEGFLPQGSLACPHCEAGVSRKGRLAMLALGAVSSVTLMACYGAPTDELSCDTQHPELGRTPIAVSDGDQSQEVTLSCGNSSELTYLFTLMPNEPSVARLTWSNTNPLTIARLNCDATSELACMGPNDTGTSTFEVLGYQTVALTGLDPSAAADTRVWVEFTPTCGDGIQQSYEQCDDGARVSGDGCSEYCFVEGGVGE
ncbi:MAG: DUF4215 domain-containing protein [Polyangiaceae bacterium]